MYRPVTQADAAKLYDQLSVGDEIEVFWYDPKEWRRAVVSGLSVLAPDRGLRDVSADDNVWYICTVLYLSVTANPSTERLCLNFRSTCVIRRIRTVDKPSPEAAMLRFVLLSTQTDAAAERTAALLVADRQVLTHPISAALTIATGAVLAVCTANRPALAARLLTPDRILTDLKLNGPRSAFRLWRDLPEADLPSAEPALTTILSAGQDISDEYESAFDICRHGPLLRCLFGRIPDGSIRWPSAAGILRQMLIRFDDDDFSYTSRFIQKLRTDDVDWLYTVLNDPSANLLATAIAFGRLSETIILLSFVPILEMDAVDGMAYDSMNLILRHIDSAIVGRMYQIAGAGFAVRSDIDAAFDRLAVYRRERRRRLSSLLSMVPVPLLDIVDLY